VTFTVPESITKDLRGQKLTVQPSLENLTAATNSLTAQFA
jgi:hypothetical protein